MQEHLGLYIEALRVWGLVQMLYWNEGKAFTDCVDGGIHILDLRTDLASCTQGPCVACNARKDEAVGDSMGEANNGARWTVAVNREGLLIP